MDFLKELFTSAEGGNLNWEAFKAAVNKAGYKLADISKGDYVSKLKYDDDLKARDTSIATLNDTISKRDTDLKNLKNQLKDAGTDATKLGELTTKFNDLQTKYDADIEAYKNQIKQQEYEFAVKDFASGKSFTSNAAKRDFIQSMIAKNLTLENGKIIGGDDFTSSYKTENPDAFNQEQPVVDTKPKFVSTTDETSTPVADPTNGFAKAFHFTPLRGEIKN